MAVYNKVTCSMDMERAVDSILLNFGKMCDVVPPNIL